MKCGQLSFSPFAISGLPRSFKSMNHLLMFKSSLLLALTLSLCSCTHTSLAPVANRSGVPVLIKIAGAKPGTPPRLSEMFRISEELLAGIPNKNLAQKYFPHSEHPPTDARAKILWKAGSFPLRNGHEVMALFPMAVITANCSPLECDQAATLLGADFYDRAKKSYVLIPITELNNTPTP
jgi:hypothetical protein